jgi:competence protein ComEC
MADAAIPAGGVGWASEWRHRLFGALADNLAAEGERRLLWLPVFFGAGIGIYFVLKVEPPLWPGIVAALAGVGFAFALRRHTGWYEAALAFTALAAGFALIREAASEREASMLQRRLGPIMVTGRVVDLDLLDNGWRLVIAPDPLPGLDAGEQPRHLRLRIPRTSDLLDPGDRVSLKAMVYPPPGPTLPGGYDFQRDAYFARIDGVGYVFGGARRIAAPEGVVSAAADGSWREGLPRLRINMERRITAALPGSTGGIASALITGKRGAISEDVTQAFRDSGLAHLLAVSGDHLGLVGGIVFFAVRALLALMPWVALRCPIKKVAAGVALIAVFCYLLICGAAVSTQRAFMMSGGLVWVTFGGLWLCLWQGSWRRWGLVAIALGVASPGPGEGPGLQRLAGFCGKKRAHDFALASCAAIRRAGEPWRLSPVRQRCPWNAVGSRRSSAKCPPGSSAGR